MKITNQSALIGVSLSKSSKQQGIAPINGPINGIRLNTNIITAISGENGMFIHTHPMKQRSATMNDSMILPMIEPRNFSEASRQTPRKR